MTELEESVHKCLYIGIREVFSILRQMETECPYQQNEQHNEHCLRCEAIWEVREKLANPHSGIWKDSQ